jgi:hypothetical protein
MNAEDRKEYNKKYYQAHKEKIIKSACEKVFCDKCGRSVIKNNIKSHQKSKICARYAIEKIAKPDIDQENVIPDPQINDIEINEQNFNIFLTKLEDFIFCKKQQQQSCVK